MTKGANPRAGAGRTQAAAKKQEVAVQDEQNKALAPVYDYGQYDGAGFEDTGREDFAMPFLYVLQSNSPIVEKGEVDEARPGVLINSVTQELYPAVKAKNDLGVVFVPCHRVHNFVEFKPRTQGGGFVGQHEVESEVVAWAQRNCKFGDFKTQAGNELTEVFSFFGLLVKEDGSAEPIILPFSSTKIKVYKQLMTRLTQIKVPTPAGPKRPALFAHRLRINTERQENDSGAFYNLIITFDGDNAVQARIDPSSELFQEAANLYDMCRSGMAKANYEGDTVKQSAESGEKIPF
jgi:hypothetical protein